MLAVLLGTPVTRDPTLVVLGASMLVAASRGHAGCESLAISNWLLRRNDQVECVPFWPIDELQSRSRAEATSSRILPALVAPKLAGCIALVVLLVDGLAG